MGLATCRFCEHHLEIDMVDLGMHPLCETFLTADQLDSPESFYPLHVRVCPNCHLAQIGEYVPPEEIFDDYAYYSSFSSAWLDHAREYVEMMVPRFGLSTKTRVMEIASNDGYLLQYFQKHGMEIIGIEPSANVARVAADNGIPSIVEFFDETLARKMSGEGYSADVIVANNVLAHTPRINQFVEGIHEVLADNGVATFEFPHLLRLIEGNQFDTIYHEHWSYLSLGSTQQIMAAHGLQVFDVEELWTHGGSLRLFVQPASFNRPVSDAVSGLLEREREFGLFSPNVYREFGAKVEATKRKLLSLLIRAKEDGATIAIYGAAGKGNTLLNYCGIGTDFIDFACDLNPYKHGRYTPGTHIPIFGPEKIKETKPDYLLLLPWNIKEELMGQLSYISEWGGRFIVPIPEATIHEAAS